MIVQKVLVFKKLPLHISLQLLPADEQLGTLNLMHCFLGQSGSHRIEWHCLADVHLLHCTLQPVMKILFLQSSIFGSIDYQQDSWQYRCLPERSTQHIHACYFNIYVRKPLSAVCEQVGTWKILAIFVCLSSYDIVNETDNKGSLLNIIY